MKPKVYLAKSNVSNPDWDRKKTEYVELPKEETVVQELSRSRKYVVIAAKMTF